MESRLLKVEKSFDSENYHHAALYGGGIGAPGIPGIPGFDAIFPGKLGIDFFPAKFSGKLGNVKSFPGNRECVTILPG